MPRVIKKVRLVNPSVRRKSRVSNPAKRKLSPLQKLFFGSKRQRTAVAKTLGSKGRKGNPSWRKSQEFKSLFKLRHPSGKDYTMLQRRKRNKLTSTTRRKKRLPNVGQILAISPLMNPRKRLSKGAKVSKSSQLNRKYRNAVYKGNWSQAAYYDSQSLDRFNDRELRKARQGSDFRDRKENPNSVTMARRKASRKRPYGANFIASGPRRKKRLRYAGKSRKGQYKYILNPRRRKAGAKRRRRYTRKANPTVVIMRRRNPSRRRRTVARATRRRYSRRRNPGFLPKGGMLMKVGGFFGGVLITNMVRNILPMQFRSGVMGILGTGISAWVASKAIRMVTGNAALANSAFFGGQTVTVVTALKEFAPGVAANLPGLGLIASSNSLYPQIPVAGAIGPPYDQAVIRGMIPAAPLRGLPAPNVTTRLMRQR